MTPKKNSTRNHLNTAPRPWALKAEGLCRSNRHGTQRPAWALHCQDSPVSSPLEIQLAETTPSGFQSLRVTALRAQSHLTLWPRMDCSPQALLSMGFSRQEYWRGLPGPPPGALPQLGIKPRLLRLLHWQVGSLPLSHLGSPQGNTSIYKSS